MNEIRNNWTLEEILAIYSTPLLELIYQSASVHRTHQKGSEVQVSSLISIKTGGCPQNRKILSKSHAPSTAPVE
jgi:biotin synthase